MSNPSLPPRQPVTGRVRRGSYSKTSSASCSNAKPSEDWTKINDLVLRRRVQNRIAQRNYREKKRLQQSQDPEHNSSSPSPSPSESPSNAPLSDPYTSPEPCREIFPTAPPTGTDYLPQQQATVFHGVYPQQYTPANDQQYPPMTEGYLRDTMTPTALPFSYPNYNATVPAQYTAFSQPPSYQSFSAGNISYTEAGYQDPCGGSSSPLRTSMAFPVTPITPTSQGEYYSRNHRSQYNVNHDARYQHIRLPATHTSATPVNTSDFFPHNYASP